MSPIFRLTVVLLLVYAVYRFLRGGGQKRRAPPSGRQPIQDFAECPICRTYIVAGAGRCGRADCPHGG